MNFEKTRSVAPVTDSLANDLSWVDNIIEDGIVHVSQCTADGSLLFLLRGPACTRRLVDDSTTGQEDHGLTTELLLEFPAMKKKDFRLLHEDSQTIESEGKGESIKISDYF